jgi:hypothetical protein
LNTLLLGVETVLVGEYFQMCLEKWPAADQ